MTISKDNHFSNLLEAVSIVTGINQEEIIKKNRSRKLLYPRQAICYFLKSYYGYTYKAIGRHFNQHHTSVMHSVSSIESMLFINDNIICDLVNRINAELVNLGHFKGYKKLVVYVPIKTDLNRLKSTLIDKYECTFDMF
jgi:hypothetical protein